MTVKIEIRNIENGVLVELEDEISKTNIRYFKTLEEAKNFVDKKVRGLAKELEMFE